MRTVNTVDGKSQCNVIQSYGLMGSLDVTMIFCNVNKAILCWSWKTLSIKNMYLYFGMGIDSPMQISTCCEQFMDAQICNSKWSIPGHVLDTYRKKMAMEKKWQ